MKEFISKWDLKSHTDFFLTVQMETHESNLRTEARRDCRELGE